MKQFAALADPIRFAMVEHLATGESTAGELSGIAHASFGVSQPAASRHLRVLREAGLVRVRVDGTSRVYSIDRDGVEAVGAWARRLEELWGGALSALGTEIARGRRERRDGGRRDTHDEHRDADQ